MTSPIFLLPMVKPLLFVVALLLAACSQLTPMERPQLPVVNHWPDREAEPKQEDAAKTHWRAFFRDPRLQALIEAALENNRDLRISVARVLEARAQFAQADASKYPILSMGPPVGTDLGTALTSGIAWPLLTVSYEVDFWGRVAATTDAARYNYLSTEEAKRAFQISLVAEVASAYFEILQANDGLANAAATIQLRSQSLKMIKKRQDLGVSDDLEYQQALGLLASTRASYAVLEHQRAVSTNKLNFLVGRTDLDLPEGWPLKAQDVSANLAPALPSEVLLLRPDVMASEHRLRASHANIDAARAAYFPKIGIQTSVGSLTGPLSNMLSLSHFGLSPVVSLPALFDGGQLDAMVLAAEARKSGAVAEYEKTIQQAFREVADQLSSRESLAKQMQAMKVNAEAQERRLKIAEAKYQIGAVGYLDVIDAERDTLASQQAVNGLLRAQIDATVQLYKVLGGGSQSE
jgi:multidrug efflux system outer membrane protein